MKKKDVDMEIIIPQEEDNHKTSESNDKFVLEEATLSQDDFLESAAPKNKFSEKKTSKKDKVISALVQDDEEESPRSLGGWKDIRDALNINGEWFKKQLGVIILIVICTILYITNRYQAQQEIIDEENLRKEFQDWKFRSLTRNSELTLKTRQSKLEQQLKALGDSTLKPNSEANYRIVKDK